MTDYKKMTKLMQARIDSLEPECDRLRKAIETFMSDMDSEWLIYALENAGSDISDARNKLRKALEVQDD